MKELQIQDLPYEESYLGFDIYIEPNPDNYRDGFCWSISKVEQEHNSGLEFDIHIALKTAYEAVENEINAET
ncbi:hypothetical protein [Shewanella sp. OMA3-2]|jgi:hypothetical protein|uniref:hypothetical protein n=1 Tax=Shewanella sp. OMA3-2 TaxID=2908650 RepID=UPI001F1E8FD7|nr:hypothetical protein [Shewanella sp. OMA3-2]UJF22033.1 hypothetical protein L0B17_00770 [Shewanella sp. OMA3-2]